MAEEQRGSRGKSYGNHKSYGSAVEELIRETPLGRLGTPEDIAYVVAFFASERAGFITGQVLTADGGFIV